MNVSAELIKSLESMLTTEQFKEFKYAIKLENNPQAALIDSWMDSSEYNVFMELLSDYSAATDEHGFVTNCSVLNVLDSRPYLLHACQCKVDGDWRWLVGSKADLEKLCTRNEPCMMAAKASTWRGDWREDMVRTLTQSLCATGVLARTDYVKDCGGTARRCYKILV